VLKLQDESRRGRFSRDSAFRNSQYKQIFRTELRKIFKSKLKHAEEILKFLKTIKSDEKYCMQSLLR